MFICRAACTFSITLLIILLLPLGAASQVIPTLGSPVEIQLLPQFPAPGTAVHVIAQNLLNKDGYSYTWTVNGQVVVQGVGISETTVPVGNVGDRTVIKLVVRDGSSIVGEATRTILPTELDIVWEADVYTPPFYTGKPRPTADSTITITAIPNIRVDGGRISSKELTYEWRVNKDRSPLKTGYGLDTISMTPPVFASTFTVSVIAKTQDGSVATENSVTITPQEPYIMLYEKSPLLGTLFNSTIGDSFTLISDEVTLQVFPLFIQNVRDTLYSWKIDGSTINTGGTPREVTLRKIGPGNGQSTLLVSLKAPRALFGESERTFRFKF